MCADGNKDEKYCKETTSNTLTKDNLSNKVQRSAAVAGQNAKVLLSKAATFVENSSTLKQIAVGAASGWVTGVVTHRVGKTAGFTLGGGIIAVAVAEQTGIININWDKVGKKFRKITGKAESIQQGPNLQYVKKYARTNTYFAAAFIGGFLLGICT